MAKVKHAPWWKRLLGISKKDKQQLNERVLGYKDSYRRCREAFDSLKSERKRRLDETRVRQEKASILRSSGRRQSPRRRIT